MYVCAYLCTYMRACVCVHIKSGSDVDKILLTFSFQGERADLD